MKQSSIDWLISFIEPSLTPEQKNFFSIVIERAKAMHKDEIIKAFQKGKWDGWENHKLKVEDKESQWTDLAHYYNETFNIEEE